MKKIVVLFGVIAVLLCMSISVFAGDVPEGLLHEDTAKVFLGTVARYTTRDLPSAPYKEIDSLEVIPTEKIKGDIEIGVKQTYAKCHSLLELRSDTEYLFGWFDDDNFYIYEIASREGNQFKLVDSEKYDMTKRLEDDLNDGSFESAEQARIAFEKYKNATVMADLWISTREETEKIEVVYAKENDAAACLVDKDQFFDLAEKIKLNPVNRMDQIDSSNGVFITAYNKDGRKHSIWLDQKARLGSTEYEFSSAVTTQYDISDADYGKLHDFMPSEAAAHIPIEKKGIHALYIVGIGLAFAVFVIVVICLVKRKRKLR